MDWTPTIQGDSGPLYESIVEALSRDIAAGRLHRGQRLPTHRALASALGVDLTTVTRAYNEARRRGLTRESAMAKLFATEAAQRVIDRAVQVFGGQGVRVGNRVESLYREIRALRIYEGASEVQKVVVARELMKGRSAQAADATC